MSGIQSSPLMIFYIPHIREILYFGATIFFAEKAGRSSDHPAVLLAVIMAMIKTPIAAAKTVMVIPVSLFMRKSRSIVPS
jgi:hypothetical protein